MTLFLSTSESPHISSYVYGTQPPHHVLLYLTRPAVPSFPPFKASGINKLERLPLISSLSCTPVLIDSWTLYLVLNRLHDLVFRLSYDFSSTFSDVM